MRSFCAAVALPLCGHGALLGQNPELAPSPPHALVTPGNAAASSLAPAPTSASPSQDRIQRSQREQWFLKGRVLPGQRSGVLLNRAYQQKMRMRASALTAKGRATSAAVVLDAGGGWSPLGPAPFASNAGSAGFELYGPVSGRATAVAVDPNDASGNTVYVGGANGGVWRSTNAGLASPDSSSVQWTPLIDNQPSLAVGAIAVQPLATAGTSLVLVGTGETNGSTDSYYGQGILRGALNAQNAWTWTPITQAGTHSFLGLGFSRIAFSRDHNQFVVAAAAGASLGLTEGLESSPTADLGLYYSTDAGVSWNYSSILDNGAAIAASSATSVIYNQATQQFFAFIRFHGIYASNSVANWATDGVSWTRRSNQPGTMSAANCPPSPSSRACPIYRGELAITPGRNEMYAWYVDANEFDQGIWLSTDGGNSWERVSTAGIDSCGDALGGCGTQEGAYNLTLAPVPNGEGTTDLYAGAVNIYKCTISSLPSPTGTLCGGGASVFLNLTHAYGCAPDFGAPAHVHPSQHAMDFLQINGSGIGQVVMYFANDGGIYRSLDGYSSLLSSDCGAPDGFDNLNSTLGSITQFVSLAQDPGDANTLVGGAQGNGFPATRQGLLSSSWDNVNSGYGGFAEINPANPSEWFTSTGGANIQMCAMGADCHAEDFASGLVVSSATLGGDDGPVDTPFILDPAILAKNGASDLIVGTCRVWRGGTDGSGFIALSPNFDTLSNDAICTGSETNLVRSLAAGGPLDSGASRMIYAGTDGYGPLVTTNPAGGRVWATDPVNGAGVWIDRTGLGAKSINPGRFPIGAIAVDDSDPSGQTAYAAITGFAPSRVWVTATAGAVWSDLTLNLPPAPVNALAIDSGGSPPTLYAGTDVGVFSLNIDPNATGPQAWVEVGPLPGSGQSGYLPNVPVTALRIFNDGTIKLLRAATYGRGIWQYVLSVIPSFVLTVPNPEQTLFGSLTTTFSIELVAVNGYGNAVSLSCAESSGATGATCIAGPTSWSATPDVVTINVSVPAAGDYSFALTAVGTDAQAITRTSTLTLHVLDYQMTAPVPASQTVSRGDSSTAISLQVGESGFNAPVTLTCGPLPAGAACSFLPSSTVNPVAGQPPVDVTLIISTDSDTPIGPSTVAIIASAPGVPTQTQDFFLTVVDYHLLAPSPASASIIQGMASTTTSLTVSADGNFSTPVSLSCGNLPVGAACQFLPSGPVNPIPGLPVNVLMTASLPSDIPVGSYSILVTASTPGASSRIQPFSLSVVDYELTATNPAGTSLVQGSTSSALSFQVTAAGGFNGAVSFACTGLPAGTTCQFDPATASPTSTQPVTVMLTVSSNSVTTPAGTFQIVIVASASGSTQRSQTFSLTVTAKPDYQLNIANPVLSVVAGQPAMFNGTLTSVGNYSSAVSLACDQNPPPTCTISPATVTPTAGGAPFTVTVSSGSAQTYNFTIDGRGADPLVVTHSQPVALNATSATFDFSFTAVGSGTQSVLAGGAASYTLDLNPMGGPFPDGVTLSPCSGLPALTTCTLAPTQVAAGNPETPVKLSITTTAPVLASARGARWPAGSFGFMIFGLGLGVAFGGRDRRSKRAAWRSGIFLVVICGLATSCGGGPTSNSLGGGQPGTRPGTYTVTVTATCGSVSHPLPLTLTVQ